MFTLARSLRPGAPKLLRQAVGRRAEATRFAGALARLLREHPLTLQTIESAGNLAAAGSKKFGQIVRAILEDMANACTFAQALRRQSSYFDPLFVGLVEAADSRERLRGCLERLGRSE